MVIFIAFLSGLLMTSGMAIAAMIDPNKVLAFLHISADWDPSLALVMGGALVVFLPGYHWVSKRQAPICDSQFHVPKQDSVDSKLVMGAGLLSPPFDTG